MEALDLLIRGVGALSAMGVLIVAARIRFRRQSEQNAPTDIGLD